MSVSLPYSGWSMVGAFRREKFFKRVAAIFFLVKRPKSESFSCSSWNRMFRGETSRCNPNWCKWPRPRQKYWFVVLFDFLAEVLATTTFEHLLSPSQNIIKIDERVVVVPFHFVKQIFLIAKFHNKTVTRTSWTHKLKCYRKTKNTKRFRYRACTPNRVSLPSKLKICVLIG